MVATDWAQDVLRNPIPRVDDKNAALVPSPTESLIPIINLIVNDKICTAMLDTGSNVTLIRKYTVNRLGLEVNESKYLSSLTGVTSQPLRVLGMVKLEVHIGDQEKHQQCFSSTRFISK